MKTKPIPQGMSMMTPSLVVKDAAKAIEFYRNVFCADEMYRLSTPDGKKIMHACLSIAGQTVFVSDPMNGNKVPGKAGSFMSVHLYVGDVDKIHQRAMANGATEVMAPENMFWGDRYSKFMDPMGMHWELATHVEDVEPTEVSKRAEEMMKSARKNKKN